MSTLFGTVVRTEPLSRRMVRIVFGGEGLESFQPTEFTDQYVNALFVPEGAPYSVPFDVEAARAEPREHQPKGRRESIRRWDADAREVTIDLVTHGDSGFAGRFAAYAKPGDRLQMAGPSGGYAPNPDADWHLLIGDESALPAVGAALDAMPPGAPVLVVAVVDGPEDEFELTTVGNPEIVWVHRQGHVDEADALVKVVADLTFPTGVPHAFVHGEAGEVRAVRKHLIADRGVPRDGQSISPYWRREHTDEQWREIKRQWLQESEADI